MGNYNVWLTFLFRVCDGIATGIWSSSVLSNYISVSQGGDDYSNEKVGIAQAVQGTFLVAAALPALQGWHGRYIRGTKPNISATQQTASNRQQEATGLNDKFMYPMAAWMTSRLRRDTILKGMGFMAYLAIASMSASLLMFGGQQQYLMLCGALALWGIAQANAPVLDSLFADSVATGKRAALYTWLHISYLLSQGLGPAVAALLFYLRGDDWSVERMKLVMVSGMVLAIIPATLLWCFNDDKALGEESEGLLKLLHARKRASGESGSSRPADETGLHQPLLGSDGNEAAGGAAWYSDEDERNLDGFNTPTVIHSPLTGHDMLTGQSAASQPTTPTRVSDRCQQSTFASDFPPDLANSTYTQSAQQQGSAGGVSAHAAGANNSDGEPDPESHAIDFSEDAGTVYSSHLSAYSAGGDGSQTGDVAHTRPTAAHILSRLQAASNPQDSPIDVVGCTSSQLLATTSNMDEDQPAIVSTSHKPNDTQLVADAPHPTLAQLALAGATHQAGQPPALVGTLQPVMEGGDDPAWPPEQHLRLPSGLVVSNAGGVLRPTIAQLRSGSLVSSTSSLDAWLPGHHGRGSVIQPLASSSNSPAGHFHSSNRHPAHAGTQASLHSHLKPEDSYNSLSLKDSGSIAATASTDYAHDGGEVQHEANTDGAPGAVRPPSLILLPRSDMLPEDQEAEQPSTPTPFSGGKASNAGSHGNAGSASRFANANAGTGTLAFNPQQTSNTQGGAATNAAGDASGDRRNNGRSSPADIRLDVAKTPGRSHSPQSYSKQHATRSHKRSPSPPKSGSRQATPRPDVHLHPPAVACAVANTGSSPAGHSAAASTTCNSAQGISRKGWGTSQAWAAQHLKRKVLSARSCWCWGPSAIPAILACTDMVMGLASGMTIKFFPIFFRQQVGLSPVYVNLMYCAVPLSLSLAAAIAQRQSLLIGKVPTMTINRAIGISLLIWIAVHVELWSAPHIMVPVCIIRTSIMNANYPIQRSILMDYVPKEQRAKWASLESVTSFGWSGSAALGGFLIHQYGFQVTFFITAAMQGIGWACSLLLLPIVPCFDITPADLQARTQHAPRRGPSRV